MQKNQTEQILALKKRVRELVMENKKLKEDCYQNKVAANNLSFVVEKLDKCADSSSYYESELEKAHALIGRLTHQLSEHLDSARITRKFPTNNAKNIRG